MPSLGNLWYALGIKDFTDQDLSRIQKKLENLGVKIDSATLRRQLEVAIGATPFNASVNFGSARASLDALFANKKYDVHVEAIASKLHDSIKNALSGWKGAEASILPKKKELRKAVTDALLSAGFEVNIGKVKGLNTVIDHALGTAHSLNVSVDPKKLATAIENAAKAYKGKDINVGIKEKYLLDSIRTALKTEKFPIKVVVNKAEAQDAVRQALQAAGIQGTGFTASDKRASDARARMMEAQARAAAANALAQRRLAGAHNAARRATDSHIHSSISLGSAMRGNIRIAGELGPMLASAYSIVALKNFMQKVIEVGGELEKQKLAMKAILGDAGMANTISSQINTLAVKSPFGIMELNQYAKQLTAFQIPYNELYDTMKRMADVSAAVGVDMGRIILAYGQVRAAKFLKGTELRQFTEANIPLIDMLAQRFTKLKGEIVSAGDIMDMISNKEISFEDVKAVLWELTSEGGRFYNMQEVLSESVQAKWKNLADAVDLMFADIAGSTSGLLKGTAELLTELTTRWETIANAIIPVVTSIGALRVETLLFNKLFAQQAVATRLHTSNWDILFGRIKKGWKRSLADMKKFFMSARGLVMTATTAIGAAITAMVVLWRRNSEEAAKAKQLGDDLLTSASEGAKNLRQILDSTPTSGMGLDSVELTSGLEKLKQAVKDYSNTADKDLLDAMVNQQGEAASLAEQYDALREKALQLAEAMETGATTEIGKMLSESITDADSGWFDDNLLTDIEDYSEAFANGQKYITKAIQKNRAEFMELLKLAKEASPSFAEIASSFRTDDQAYAELIGNYTKYAKEIGSVNLDLKKTLFGYYSGYISEFGNQRREFEKEWRQVIEKQIASAAVKGITPDTLSDKDSINLIAWFEKTTEGLPEEGKRLAREIFEKMWEIDTDDGTAQKAIVDAFGSLIEAAHPEIARKLKAGMSLKDLELIDYSSAAMMVLNAASNVMTMMPQFRDKIQGWLDDNEFTAKIAVQWQNADIDIKKMLWSSDPENLPPNADDRIIAAEKIFDKMASGAKSTRDVRDKYIKEGKDIKERIEAAKKNNAAAEELAKLNDEWNLTAESFRRAHFGSLESAVKEKNSGGSGKDPLLDRFKARFKDLKDAWAMYESWQKSVGDDAAFNTVANSGLFQYIELDKIPRSVEAYDKAIEALKAELESAGVKGNSGRESLLNDMIKTLFDVRKSVVDEQLNKTKKEIDFMVADVTKKWDFYKAIFEQTGNKEASMRLAFGESVAWTDATKQLQDELERRLGEKGLSVPVTLSDEDAEEKLKGTGLFDLWKKVKESIESDGIELRVNVAKAVADAASIADKIKTQEGLRNGYEAELRLKIPDITEPEVEAALKPYNDRILELKSSMLELLPVWDQIFGDHQYQSYGQIKAASDIARQIIDNAKITKKDGKPVSFTSTFTDDNGDEQQISGKISQLDRLRKAIQELYKEGLKKSPFKTLLENIQSLFNGNWKDKELSEKLAMIGESAAESAEIVGNLANALSDMFDSMGKEGAAQAMSDIGDAMSTVANIGKGFAEGGLIGGIASAAGEAISWMTKIFQRHDAKLQKQIERSKEAAQILQNQYDLLEARMKNFLGNAANMNTGTEGGAYGRQRELMSKQLEELEKQRQAEIDKKKSDDSVVEDYKKQIEEMEIAIRDFALEAANDLYGIDLNGWAEQLGDTLVDAFAAGEDAAKAFDRTVGAIMRDVASKMISQDILAPMFGDLREFLFGADGMGGAFGADFKLDPSELAAMKEYLDRIKNEGIPAAEDLFDAINNATGGLLDETDKAKGGLSAGIQSVTEDTADLLASYVNSIRASVAMGEERWGRLLDESLPQMSVIAQSQLECQRQIAENTLRNAVAAEMIAEKTDKMERSWRRIAERTWGYS